MLAPLCSYIQKHSTQRRIRRMCRKKNMLSNYFLVTTRQVFGNNNNFAGKLYKEPSGAILLTSYVQLVLSDRRDCYMEIIT